MELKTDKLMHLGMGFFTAAATAVIILIYHYFGIGPAVAAATTVVGIGYEVQQRVRKSGEPSWKDALATAVPGYLVWLAVALATVAQQSLNP